MTSAKHYVAVSEVIASELRFANLSEGPAEVRDAEIATAASIARRLADLYAADNPLFNRELFYSACTLDKDGR